MGGVESRTLGSLTFVLRPNQSETRYHAADDSVYTKSWAVRLEVGENTAVGRAMTKPRVV